MARRKRFLGKKILPPAFVKNNDSEMPNEDKKYLRVTIEQSRDKMLINADLGSSSDSRLQTVDSSLEAFQGSSNNFEKNKTHQNVPQNNFVKRTKREISSIFDSERTKIRKSAHVEEVDLSCKKKRIGRYKCPDCDFKCYYQSILRTHYKKHTGVKPFSCTLCHYKTALRATLNRHVAMMHNSEPPISCLQCDFRCATKKKLVNHMRVHSGKSYFKCNQCDYVHGVQAQVRRHMLTHTAKGLRCDTCGYKAVKPENLERHINKRHRHKLSNDLQGDILTSTTENINIDTVSESGIKQPVVCLERCDDRSIDPDNSPLPNMNDLIAELLLEDFKHLSKIDNDQSFNTTAEQDMDKTNILDGSQQTNNEYLKVLALPGDYEIVSSLSPIRQRQNNIPPEVTMCCQITFRKKRIATGNDEHCEDSLLKSNDHGSPGKLNVSRWKHKMNSTYNQSLFFCSKCEFTFDDQTSLISHQLYNHGESEPFKCKTCDYTCFIRKHMTNHLKTHQTPTALICDKCTFISKSSHTLKKHMENHNDTSRFACDKCAYRSRYRSTLDVHKFIHTGKTKHVCKICGYKASVKSTLQRHMKVHQEKKITTILPKKREI